MRVDAQRERRVGVPGLFHDRLRVVAPGNAETPGLLGDRGSTFYKMVEPTGIEPVTSCLQIEDQVSRERQF